MYYLAYLSTRKLSITNQVQWKMTRREREAKEASLSDTLPLKMRAVVRLIRLAMTVHVV